MLWDSDSCLKLLENARGFFCLCEYVVSFKLTVSLISFRLYVLTWLLWAVFTSSIGLISKAFMPLYAILVCLMCVLPRSLCGTLMVVCTILRSQCFSSVDSDRFYIYVPQEWAQDFLYRFRCYFSLPFLFLKPIIFPLPSVFRSFLFWCSCWKTRDLLFLCYVAVPITGYASGQSWNGMGKSSFTYPSAAASMSWWEKRVLLVRVGIIPM